jgi:hypothetical protein
MNMKQRKTKKNKEKQRKTKKTILKDLRLMNKKHEMFLLVSLL